MATTYNINYDDARFQQVEEEKQEALDNVNNTYNSMINQSDKYYQDQIQAAQDYSTTQQQIQQQNTDLQIEQINQQKDQAAKDYTKEQAGSYVDWQKQSNNYGAKAEQMAAQGLAGSGYSESSQVSMYNQYQSRITSAREVYNKAVLNYDNSIKEAQLANNSKLAEIAYQALQTQLELSLQGFQYKNTLLQAQLEQQQATEDRYYSRWQDVLNQMNTENEFNEQIRQYEQNFAEQQRQFNEEYAFKEKEFAEQKRQYEQDYNFKIKQFNEQIRQFNAEQDRLIKQDAIKNKLEVQELELKKKQIDASIEQTKKEYELALKKLAQDQAQWQAEYNLKAKKAAATVSSTSTITKDTTSKVTKDTSTSGGTVTLSNGKTGYSDAISAYKSVGGTSPYNAQGLLDNGLVKKVTYNGKTYYYGVAATTSSVGVTAPSIINKIGLAGLPLK
ncbi:MAG: hypothetical protein MJZ37_06225 [Bacilli bacterium]|nr:hypothetical protein [Bacilli bacterium]